MEHSAFVEKYHSNQISVSVDKNNAGFMYKTPGVMPQNLRAKQAMFRTVAYGGSLLGIALFFFTSWWVALGVLLAGLFMFPQAQKSAARGVLEASLEHPSVYKVAVDNEVIVMREPA